MTSNKDSPEKTSPGAWAIAISLALIAGIYFLKLYLGIIALGLLVAFIFYPTYEWIRQKSKSTAVASTLTTILSILLVGIPAIIVIVLTISQTLTLVNNISGNFQFGPDQGLKDVLTDLTATANTRLESLIGISDAFKQSDIQSFLERTLPNALRSVANSMLGLAAGIPTYITTLIIYLFVFTGSLTNGKKLIKLVKAMSPFDEQTNELYMGRIGAMAKAMLKGQLVIATAQGVVSALVLAILGFSEYFLFFAVLLTFLSFIPLGAGIVTIPLALLMLALGNIWGGLFVLLNHFVVITNIDNIIRPKLVPKEAEMHPALLILSAFAGVYYYGFLGVIYGPIIMIIISTTIESYLTYKKRIS